MPFVVMVRLCYKGRLPNKYLALQDVSLIFPSCNIAQLETRGYDNQSATDQCVFIGKESIVLTYVDNCIIFSKKGSNKLDSLIKSGANGKEYFEFTNEGYLKRYLGVDIKMHKDGSIEVTQPHLIE